MSSKTAQPLYRGNSSCMLQSYRLQTHLKIQSSLSTYAAVLTNELQCLSSAKPRHSLWFMDCKHLAAGACTCSLYPCIRNFLVCSHNVPAPALPYYQQAQDPHFSENGLSITEPLWYRTWIKSSERGFSDIQPLNQYPPSNTAKTIINLMHNHWKKDVLLLVCLPYKERFSESPLLLYLSSTCF